MSNKDPIEILKSYRPKMKMIKKRYEIPMVYLVYYHIIMDKAYYMPTYIHLK